MRIQMLTTNHVETEGSRITFNGGEFYIVDDATAADFISAGVAIDPDNPPAPAPEPEPEQDAPAEADAEVTE